MAACRSHWRCVYDGPRCKRPRVASPHGAPLAGSTGARRCAAWHDLPRAEEDRLTMDECTSMSDDEWACRALAPPRPGSGEREASEE